jgi:hypothetical protein
MLDAHLSRGPFRTHHTSTSHHIAEPYLFEFDQILRRLRIFW